MYPVSVYHIDCAAGANVLDCHWHDEMEFILVKKGQAVFQVGTVSYEVVENQALFVNSGDIHAGYPLGNAACSYSALVFGRDFLAGPMYDLIQDKYLEPLIRRKCSLPVHIRGEAWWEKEVLALLHHIVQSNTDLTPTCELTTKGNLYLILAQLFGQARDLESSQFQAVQWKTEQMKAVLQYIHERYREPIRLHELSQLANMSEGHFCRFFKKMMKRSAVEYINDYRTRQAARLIERTDRKLAEIAMDTGFENISYFTSVFKRQIGVTPSQYRKKSRSETTG
nr:AraC family transcriptional regulator [Paenibacillus hamazuiensis]